ncbi:hypothetical protein JTB14_008386 [Gonioctena quinquepunctata]|nr:hypothetical protein JTB14_008386 [Gonioctena quinquepunctata]
MTDDGRFMCCKNKKCGDLVCIMCYSVYHPSCLERKTYFKKLGGVKIYCSEKCEQNDSNKKCSLLDELVNDKDDVIRKMENEIKALKDDLEAKDMFLTRELRKSQSFMEDVIDVESQFEGKIKEQKELITQLNKELTTVRQHNQRHFEKAEDLEKRNMAMKYELDEANTLNSKMASDMRTRVAEELENSRKIERGKNRKQKENLIVGVDETINDAVQETVQDSTPEINVLNNIVNTAYQEASQVSRDIQTSSTDVIAVHSNVKIPSQEISQDVIVVKNKVNSTCHDLGQDTSDIQFSSPDVQLDQRITEPQEELPHIICSKDCKTKKFEDQLERLKKDFADIKDTIKRKYQHQNKNNSKSVEKAGKTSNLCNGFTVEVIDESLNENVNPSPYKNVTLPEGGLLNLDKTFPAEEKNGQNELEDEYLNAQDNAKIGSPSSSNQQKRILVIGDEYGKNFARVLDLVIDTSEYCAHEIIKPKMELSEMSRNIFNDTIAFGSKDVVIMVFNTNNVSNNHTLRSAMRDILPAKPLSHIVNHSFQVGVFPDVLKISKILPIYKGKGSRQDCGNYRPIALLSQFAKSVGRRNLAASIETLKSIVRSLEAKDKSFECLDVSEVNVAKIPLSSPMNAELSRSIEYNKKPKILILCDETGYGLGKTFSRIYGNTFNIQSIIKPSANFENVIDDVINLSDNYCLDDHIIILAGSNDFKTKKYPSFKKLNSKLKICTNTNIILSSVPYNRNYKVNEMIYRYNIKLNDYAMKLNHYAEGNISFLDINNSEAFPNADEALYKFRIHTYFESGFVVKVKYSQKPN